MYTLLIRHLNGVKAGTVKRFEFADELSVRMGRSSMADVVFDSAEDMIVSREHALLNIVVDDSIRATVQDLHSSNGTYVNSERTDPGASVILRNSSLIQLGSIGPKVEVIWLEGKAPEGLMQPASEARGLSVFAPPKGGEFDSSKDKSPNGSTGSGFNWDAEVPDRKTTMLKALSSYQTSLSVEDAGKGRRSWVKKAVLALVLIAGAIIGVILADYAAKIESTKRDKQAGASIEPISEAAPKSDNNNSNKASGEGSWMPNLGDFSFQRILDFEPEDTK